LSDLSNEAHVRRQRAHEIANVLGALHMDGLDVDPQDLATAQRYVDGEISAATITAAISRRALGSQTSRLEITTGDLDGDIRERPFGVGRRQS
jgi:hypothetical protein